MSSESPMRKRMQKREFLSYCSQTVANFIVDDSSIDMKTKVEISEKARMNVIREGRNRVHWEDFNPLLQNYIRRMKNKV